MPVGQRGPSAFVLGLTFVVVMSGCASARKATDYGFSFEEAHAALENGEAREALAYYEAAARTFAGQGLFLEAAWAHKAAANIVIRLGRFQDGIRHCIRGLESLERAQTFANIEGLLVELYSEAGYASILAGDADGARRHYVAGLQLARNTSDRRSGLHWQSLFLNALGRISLHKDRDHSRALELARESQSRIEELLNIDPNPQWEMSRRRRLILALLSEAAVHMELEQVNAAKSAVDRATKFMWGFSAFDLEMWVRSAQGRIAYKEGKFEEALERFDAARRIAAQVGHESEVGALYGSARAKARLGRHDAAVPLLERVLDLTDAQRANIDQAGLRTLFVENRQAFYEAAVESALALDRVSLAFEYAERARARAFLDLLGTRHITTEERLSEITTEEAHLRTRLEEARAAARLARGSARRKTEAELEAAESAYRAFLDRLHGEDPERGSLLAIRPVAAAELQALIPEGKLLLEYMVLEKEVVVWIVARDSIQARRLAISRPELRRLTYEFRRAIAERADLAQVTILSEALYQSIFGPLRAALDTRALIIAPHDALHYLPFGALKTPGGRWVVEDFELTTVPSASILKYLSGKKGRAGRDVLVVGNPALGPALELRYAMREAQLVAARYPGSTALIGDDATEARAKHFIQRAELVHLAVHGHLREDDPLSSALLMMPGDGEDGRLEVREVFGLALNARLVVLSACETALGRLSTGDELVGLQRAFLYAGTPTVVTTLWSVDDGASFELMRLFYDELDVLGVSGALAEAQRTIMREYRHPYFWAAYLLTGRRE